MHVLMGQLKWCESRALAKARLPSMIANLQVSLIFIRPAYLQAAEDLMDICSESHPSASHPPSPPVEGCPLPPSAPIAPPLELALVHPGIRPGEDRVAELQGQVEAWEALYAETERSREDLEGRLQRSCERQQVLEDRIRLDQLKGELFYHTIPLVYVSN